MEKVLLPSPVKRVIRNKATGLYLREGESATWAASPDDATEYTTIRRMVDVCRHFGLGDVELVDRLVDDSQAMSLAGEADGY